MHYGKKLSWWRQCDALGNALLGNTGSCGCYCAMHHLPKHCCRPCTPFMETVFPDGCGLFQQDNVPCHKAGMVWGAQQQGVDLASKFPRSQSNRASVGCAGQTSPIHGAPTSQLTGLKGSATNTLVPDTTAHLQGSSGVMPWWVWAVLATKVDQHNIRQVVIMLCLICVCMNYCKLLSMLLLMNYCHFGWKHLLNALNVIGKGELIFVFCSSLLCT